ncbi:MAG: cation:proton antiporter [Pseudomonadota bacterium]
MNRVRHRRACPVRIAEVGEQLAIGRGQRILFWSGLRGALALVLGVPASLPGRDALLTMTFSVVLFSIVVQGLALTPLMRRLGLVPLDREPGGARRSRHRRAPRRARAVPPPRSPLTTGWPPGPAAAPQEPPNPFAPPAL